MARLDPANWDTKFFLGGAGDGSNDAEVAPDGTYWYTGTNAGVLGYVKPDGIAEAPVVGGVIGMSRPAGIALTPGGDVWFTEPDRDRIGRRNQDGTITRFSAGITPGSQPTGITMGPDGNLWFGEAGTKHLGRITPDGSVTELAAATTDAPLKIVLSGGNLWILEGRRLDGGAIARERIGRLTPQGVLTEFTPELLPVDPNVGLTTLGDITAGPDGNLWITDAGGRIGRMTPAGEITWFATGVPDGSVPFSITSAGGDLWFGMRSFDGIGRITTTGAVTLYKAEAPNNAYPIADGQSPEAVAYIRSQFGAWGIVGGADGSVWFDGQAGYLPLRHGTVPDRVGDPCNHDEDNDTHLDWADAFPNDPAEWVDTDADGIGNNADTDDDNDGLVDTLDPKPLNPDADSDGVKDGADNCVLNANADQADTDHDGIGDRCDRTVVLNGLHRRGRSLHATLQDTAGHPVIGVPLTFRTRGGAKICRPRTDSTGQARCTAARRYAGRLHRGFRAGFDGDALHDQATARIGPTLTVSTRKVRPGATFTVTATGLKPGMRATIWLAGERVYVGHADAQGVVRRDVSFQRGTTAGPRRVRVSGYLKSDKDGTYYDRAFTVLTTVRYLDPSRGWRGVPGQY